MAFTSSSGISSQEGLAEGGRAPGEVAGGSAAVVSEEDLVRESAEVARRLSLSRVVSNDGTLSVKHACLRMARRSLCEGHACVCV